MRDNVSLTVEDSPPGDMGKGIARLSAVTRKHLNLQPGHVIEVTGKRATAVVVERAQPDDEGRPIIRLDAVTRHNARTMLGEDVTIKKADVDECEEMTLAPGAGQRPCTSLQLKRVLLGRAVVENDEFRPPASLRGPDLGATFIMTAVRPTGVPVLVTERTTITVLPHSGDTTPASTAVEQPSPQDLALANLRTAIHQLEQRQQQARAQQAALKRGPNTDQALEAFFTGYLKGLAEAIDRLHLPECFPETTSTSHKQQS